MTLNSSESSSSYELITYEKMNYELKNVQNVLGVLLITILKFRNNCFYKNLYSKTRRLKKSIHFLDILGGKINIDNRSENFKCGILEEKSGNLLL